MLAEVKEFASSFDLSDLNLTYQSCLDRLSQLKVVKLKTDLSFLAVDDDPVFLAVLSQMMVLLGYNEPKIASSGLDALSLLQTQKHFDCILLDIQMPGIDGITTCQRIRQLPHHAMTPIMMVTTLNGRSFVDYAFAAGATDYLTKPLNKTELGARLGMMERLIAERQRSGSLERDMSSLSDLPGIGFAFDDAVPLPAGDFLIDYLALENHLLTLGRLRLYGQSAIAFQVASAHHMYHELEPIEYLDYMADVGRAIVASLKRHSFMLAHAGSGEFVCVFDRRQSVDVADIKQNISIQLQMLRSNYEDLGLPIPEIKVGTVESSGILSPSMAKKILSRARMAVKGIEMLELAEPSFGPKNFL